MERITVSKSQDMIVLLDSININYKVNQDSIELLCSRFELTQTIVGTDEDIQFIFGNTNVWQELTKLMM